MNKICLWAQTVSKKIKEIFASKSSGSFFTDKSTVLENSITGEIISNFKISNFDRIKKAKEDYDKELDNASISYSDKSTGGSEIPQRAAVILFAVPNRSGGCFSHEQLVLFCTGIFTGIVFSLILYVIIHGRGKLK